MEIFTIVAESLRTPAVRVCLTRSRQADLSVSTVRSHLSTSTTSIVRSRSVFVVFVVFRSFRSSQRGTTPCTFPSSQTHYFYYTASACQMFHTRRLSFPRAQAGKSATWASFGASRTSWSDRLANLPFPMGVYSLESRTAWLSLAVT